MNTTFYITTTLPYVNAEPHIGFAQEILAADVIARYQKSLGKQVIFNTGTDEHGQKIFQKAVENNQSPQEYVDFWADKFKDLQKLLDLDYTHFIRTTDPHHCAAAQEFWIRCQKAGDIYKKTYETAYCVGCEMEKQASELVEGKCPLHPTTALEIREEENYFFRFSKYQQALLNLYETNPTFVKPESKLKEIHSFVSSGLHDFSISRLASKMSWGIPVPEDPEHVMYVWFDALVNYISTLGWPQDTKKFSEYWPVVQLAGKDNLRQQAAMWQAMLMSAGISPSEQILINGFIGVEGQKMSKSLGNVIAPQDMVDRYGTEATRLLLMNLGPFGTDMDVSYDKFDTTFTALLSNGLGNLCSRVAKLCEKTGATYNSKKYKPTLQAEFEKSMQEYELKTALDMALSGVSYADHYLSENQPWKKQGEEQVQILQTSITHILEIAIHLVPFMPKTAQTILTHFSQQSITALEPLFPRLTAKL